MDVGRQDREQEQDQRDGGETTRARDEETDGAEDLADASERHHELGIRDERRHHRHHVRSHAVEVRRGGEAEHRGQTDASRRGQVPEVIHAPLSDQPGDERHNDENNQRCQ
jgi:hypothetical protein